MNNTFQNLHHNKHLSYNHHSVMVNECMFPTLFPFGIGVPKMNNKPMKVSLQMHVKYLMNLDENYHQISKHHLFMDF